LDTGVLAGVPLAGRTQAINVVERQILNVFLERVLWHFLSVYVFPLVARCQTDAEDALLNIIELVGLPGLY
jgi:hypothetical protein